MSDHKNDDYHWTYSKQIFAAYIFQLFTALCCPCITQMQNMNKIIMLWAVYCSLQLPFNLPVEISSDD